MRKSQSVCISLGFIYQAMIDMIIELHASDIIDYILLTWNVTWNMYYVQIYNNTNLKRITFLLLLM